MTLFRLKGSKYWYFDFTFRGQRYHGSTKCTAKRDAERFESEEKRKAALGTQRKPEISIDAAFGTWWENKGKHLRSAKTVEGQLERLQAALGSTARIGGITFADLDDYVARRRANVANATVNREIELCRRVWRYTEKRGFEVGQTIDWGKLLLAEPKERARELTADEEARLFEQLPADLAAVVEFALLSGQRRTAIITLLWRHVDLAAGVAKVRLKAEADEWHTFPLSPRMIDIIRSRPKVCAQVFTYECERPSPPRRANNGSWIPGRRKGVRYPFSLQGWTRRWRKALADAKIEDFRFHDLRHTAGTRVTRAVGNLRVTQRLLAHKNIATTARYAHATQDDVLQALIAAETQIIPKVGAADMPEKPVTSIRKADA
ncbi:MAG: site-specific integrase [Sphingomonadales bacterium]